MLESRFEIEVIGPLFGERVWPPCDTNEFTYKPIPCSPSLPQFLISMRKIANLVSGDIVYTSKPLVSSFGVGILNKLTSRRPLILDIDDWELGWFLPYRFRKMASLSVKSTSEVHGFLNTFCMEKITFVANGITTASRFLQNRFGGEYIPHARDTELFDPSRYVGEKIKRELGLKDEKIIMFLGSPKPHKGIEDLFAAIRSLMRTDVRLLIIGASDGYLSKSLFLDGVNHLTIVKGIVPFMRIPEYLACSDLVVLPQNKVPSNHAQVPAKLFDAMAMAKPIVSTKISDMPEILKDCGLIVETDSPVDLAEKIDFILENPNLAKEMGQRARERCIEKYSLRVVKESLNNYISEITK
jgi:glycosyltransferase involved in cell wall biosynthesis